VYEIKFEDFNTCYANIIKSLLKKPVQNYDISTFLISKNNYSECIDKSSSKREFLKMNTTRRQFNLSMEQESLAKHLEIANINETSSVQINRTDNKNKTSNFIEKINQTKFNSDQKKVI